MRRLFLVASLVLVAALVAAFAVFGPQRLLDLGLSTVLVPIESDSREEAGVPPRRDGHSRSGHKSGQTRR